MQTTDRMPTPEEFALNVLKQRDQAAEILEDLRDSVSASDVRSMEKVVNRYDKLIRDYGLRRYEGRV